MTDIVERLRQHQRWGGPPMFKEAADEIERLRGLYKLGLDLTDEYEKLEADNERLRALLVAARALLQHHAVLYPDEIDDTLEPKP